VDTLHGLTLFVILVVVVANAYSLRLIKKEKVKQAIKFDNRTAAAVFITYVILNIWFIWQAINGN